MVWINMQFPDNSNLSVCGHVLIEQLLNKGYWFALRGVSEIK